MDRPEPDGPRAEYERRLAARRAEAARQARRHWFSGNGRVAVVLLAVALVYPTLVGRQLSAAWLGLPLVLFLAVSVVHDRVSRALRRAERAAAFYEKALARLDQRWPGTGQQGTRFLDPRHSYAADLDLFGPGSLFELLCTARTTAGEDTLAGWLLASSTIDEVRARQGAVADLRPRLDLREDIALLGGDVPAGTDFQGLAAWGEAPRVAFSRPDRWPVTAVAVLAVVAVLAWAADLVGPSPFLLALMLEGGAALRLRRRVQQVLAPVDRRGTDALMLAGLLARIEAEPFTAPRLLQLQVALRTDGVPPSRRIHRLSVLLDWLESKHNPLFAPVAAMLLWSAHLAFALEDWRDRAGPGIRHWVRAVGEFEALSALATYAYEHPADPFAEVVAGGPCYEGTGLGHPLIPEARSVRNDLCLGGEVTLLIVSGSNMSGKSTLLRAVGVNAVLALAGAPVRAVRLRLSPLAVGATLRIQDSLQEGRSRFFAEVTRVRQLVELAHGPLPLLFLLDELFQGTNSHDRRLGAEAVVRGLVGSGAIGLITTHDLALTQIADRLGPRAGNVHFEDHLENGAMTFDYRVRPGVVQKSNALALMRAVGLDV